MELHESSFNTTSSNSQSYNVTKKAFGLFLGSLLLVALITHARQSDWNTVIIMGALIVLALFISFIQEKHARELPELAKKMGNLSCTIMRDGKHMIVGAAALRIGDSIYANPDAQNTESLGFVVEHDQSLHSAYTINNSMRYFSYSWDDYALEQVRFSMRKATQGMNYFFTCVYAQIGIIMSSLLFGLPELFTLYQLFVLSGVTLIFLQILLSTAFSYPIPLHAKKMFIIHGGITLSLYEIVCDALLVMSAVLLIFCANYKDDLAYARTMALMTFMLLQLYHAWHYRAMIIAFQQKNGIRPLFLMMAATGILVCLGAALLYTPFEPTIFKTVSLGLNDWRIIFMIVLPIIILEKIRKCVVSKFWK